MAETSHHRLCPGEGGDLPPDRCALCGLLNRAEREALADLQEKVRELQQGSYVSWRAAAPGDIASAAEAGGECVAYSKVLDLIDGAEDD